MGLSALFSIPAFFLAIVVHAFLLTTVLKRPRKGTFEKLLIGLLTGLMVWYAGNFMAALLRQMDISKVGTAIMVFDALAFSALSLMPAGLLHTHWIYFGLHRLPSRAEQRVIPVLIALLYGSLLLLPLALVSLFSSVAVHPLEKLGPYRTPFLGLLGIAYIGSAYLQYRIVRNPQTPVEKSLFQRLLVLFAAIPVFTLYVFEFADPASPIYSLLVTAALLASVLPSVLVAYYIYRYQFLQLPVHRGLASGLLVLAVLLIYLLGTRFLGAYLERELGTSSRLLEITLLAGLLLLFGPVSQWLDKWISRGFVEEIDRYRILSERIRLKSYTEISSEHLAESVSDEINAALPDTHARIVLGSGGPETVGSIPLLGVGGEPMGVLSLTSSHRPSPGTREGIKILATEIAVAIERCRMLERQLELERDLSGKSHLEDLGRMAATIAHNVKNPLSSMKTLLQLQLESRDLTSDQREEFAMIVQEIDRLSRTVSSLLKFSRLGSGSTAVPSASSDVPSVVHTILGLFKGNLTGRGLEVRTSLQVPAGLCLDEEALKDVVSNLLGNAVDASPDGGVIRIEATTHASSLRLAVEDEGVGVPAEVQDTIFEPFVSTKSTGTGLGLSIVRERVNQLNGRVFVGPGRTGRGTRFEIEIPIGRDRNGGHGDALNQTMI